MKEVDFFGVYLSPFLLWSVLAFLVLWITRLFLGRLGVYHHVWHRSLFDLSLYVVILACLIFFARPTTQ